MEKISNGILEVQIAETGAELRSIRKDGAEYLWQGDEKHWKRHAPLLFPFVGRLTEKRYVYKGESYEMTSHGFAPTSAFSVASNKGDAVTFTLSSDEETRRIYPFDFSLSVTYSLSGNTLTESVEVRNAGRGEMLYGIGFHPGFCLPMEDGLEFADYEITFPEMTDPEYRVFAPDHLEAGYNESYKGMTGKAIKLDHELFADDAIVLHGMGGRAVLSSPKGRRSVEVQYDAPWVGLWQTYAPDTPFLCIEPWYTLPGHTGTIVDISKRDDFIHLGEGESRTHSISMIIG